MKQKKQPLQEKKHLMLICIYCISFILITVLITISYYTHLLFLEVAAILLCLFISSLAVFNQVEHKSKKSN